MRRPPLRVWLQLAAVLYPLYVWWAISRWHPAAALLPVALLAIIQALRGGSPAQRGFYLLSGLLLLVAFLLDLAEEALFYYPVWVNSGLLLLFGYSLLYPPTVIERLARMMEGELDAKAIAYTRNVTIAWCLFFLGNGSLAAVTAWLGNWDLWLLYNGLVSYLLMGLLMLIEWIVRRYVRTAR